MEEYCKNCGAPLKEDSNFCEDCGFKVETQKPKIDEDVNFCPNCGKELEDSAYFCEHCGVNLANPVEKSDYKDFIEKYKLPIIVGGILIFLVIIGMIFLTSSHESSQIDLPAQTVIVGTEYFEIPGRFHTSPTSFDIDTDGGVISFSQSWSDNTDSFNIAILSSGYNVDLDSVAASEGGIHKNLMGYDGYYNEIDVGDYSFTFVLDNKICVVEASSPYIFDEIKVV